LTKRRGNGEGSITRHKKSGLYMARYWVEMPKGPKRKTIYGKKRDDVAEKLAKALSNRADGIVVDDKNLIVGDYLNRWLSDSVRGTVRESTFSRDKYLVVNHVKPSVGRLKLKNLNALHLQASTASAWTPASQHQRYRRSITSCTRRSPKP
jgi:integrase